MNEQFPLFNIQKAQVYDWENILSLLEEAGLREYLSDEKFNNKFYVLYDIDKLICTFAIDYKEPLGILKSFAVSKIIQGKGIGRRVANSMDLFVKDLGLNKLYASSWEAFDFWRKTVFKEISLDDCSDAYFLDYVKDLERTFPIQFKKIKHFCLVVES